MLISAQAPVVPAKEVLAATIVHNNLTTPSLPFPSTPEEVAERVTRVVADYLLTTGEHDQFEEKGRAYLKSRIAWHINANIPIELVLPAFPFKSPSLKKVLGTLPDLTEEIFLRRLEDLCRAIEDYYPAGAQLKIVSDGIVYSQLLGVTDRTAFRYNSELRRLVADLGLGHIQFVRVQDLLSGAHKTGDIQDLDEAAYIVAAPKTREAFLSTDIGQYDVEKHIKADEGALRTYRGYLTFLKKDLDGGEVLHPKNEDGTPAPLSKKARERIISEIAKKMMGNGAKFSALVEKSFTTAVRLSIHAHTNSGPKFAVRIFQTVEQAATPWHNSAVINLDGTISIQHTHTVDPETHDLVERNGRPYYWRAKNPDMDWGDLSVTFDPMFPYGLVIKPTPGAQISWSELPMDKMRKLASRYSYILARGFGAVEKPEYRNKANEMGTVMNWVWGDILEVKENPELDMNNTTTREGMPFHYDGVFKTKTLEDGTIIDDPPQFQMFQCRHAPSTTDPNSQAGGRTLFTNTHRLYNETFENDRSRFAKVVKDGKWTVFTPSNASFGGDPLLLPLVVVNPLSSRKTLRWHEAWPQHITAYKPTFVEVEGLSKEESAALSDHISELLYDRRFCYQHTWQTGDYVIADNFELMHTRTAFNPCNRELWRIHIN